MRLTVESRGPFFDADTARWAAELRNDSEKAVATIGASMIWSRMAAVFRKETPFYRFTNVAEKAPPGWIVWDQDKTLYGFWLEGVGSRNRTTRFKGYFTYRRITQELRARTEVIASGVVRRFVERLS